MRTVSGGGAGSAARLGLAIGAAGFAIGAMIGTQFEDSCQELECFDEAFWMGSALGAVGAGLHGAGLRER